MINLEQIKEMQIETTPRHRFPPIRLAKIHKFGKLQVLLGRLGGNEPVQLMGMQNGATPSQRN